MASNHGDIIMTRFAGFDGLPERIEYAWNGGPEVLVSMDFIDYANKEVAWIVKDKMLKVGPYKLAVKDIDYARDVYECVQVNMPLNWLRVYWHRSNRLIDLAYRRFIITLAVWKLAEFSRYEVPTLNNVYAVKKVKKIWQMIIAR